MLAIILRLYYLPIVPFAKQEKKERQTNEIKRTAAAIAAEQKATKKGSQKKENGTGSERERRERERKNNENLIGKTDRSNSTHIRAACIWIHLKFILQKGINVKMVPSFLFFYYLARILKICAGVVCAMHALDDEVPVTPGEREKKKKEKMNAHTHTWVVEMGKKTTGNTFQAHKDRMDWFIFRVSLCVMCQH